MAAMGMGASIYTTDAKVKVAAKATVFSTVLFWQHAGIAGAVFGSAVSGSINASGAWAAVNEDPWEFVYEQLGWYVQAVVDATNNADIRLSDDGWGGQGGSPDDRPPDERPLSELDRLTKDDIKKLEKQGGAHKVKQSNSKQDLYKDEKGNVWGPLNNPAHPISLG
jgi:hypothetical protein